MEVLQYAYKGIFNSVFLIINKISERTRIRILSFLIFLQVSSIAVFYSDSFFGFRLSEAEMNILGIVLFFCIIVFSMDSPLKLVKWDKKISIIWLIFGILTVASVFINDQTEAFTGLMFILLFEFPALYYVWNQRGDYETLFDILAKVFIIEALVCFMFAIFVVPYDPDVPGDFGIRYAGTTINPICLGWFTVAGVVSSLYLVVRRSKGFVLYSCTCGICVMLSFITGTRSSMLAVLMVAVLFVCFAVKQIVCINKRDSKSILRLVICLIIISISAPVSYKMVTSSVFTLESVFAQELEEEQNNNINQLESRFSMQGKDINSFSSGRINLWKTFIEELNLTGHDEEHRNTVIYVKTGLHKTHNTPLEFAYVSGIPAGILYLIINIISAVFVVYLVFSKQEIKDYCYFVAFTAVGFGIPSMLETAVQPFSNPMSYLYFISLMVFWDKNTIKLGLSHSKNKGERE